MAQLPSPNQGKNFRKVEGNKGYYYDESHVEQLEVYKPVRPDNPNSPVVKTVEPVEIPHNPEVIDLRTGESNSKYWQPEVVMNAGDCDHKYVLTDVGKREIECNDCGHITQFHVGINYKEKNGKPYFVANNREYLITYK